MPTKERKAKNAALNAEQKKVLSSMPSHIHSRALRRLQYSKLDPISPLMAAILDPRGGITYDEEGNRYVAHGGGHNKGTDKQSEEKWQRIAKLKAKYPQDWGNRKMTAKIAEAEGISRRTLQIYINLDREKTQGR